MYKGKKILGIIPARGGSKGLPHKNIMPVLKKPLIAWTIEQAFLSEYLDRVIVTTDDRKIAAVARRYGAEVPFMRPTRLARDNSPVSLSILHALDYFENKGQRYDVVVLLEATSPVRYKNDIDNAIIKLITSKNAGSVVAVAAATNDNPLWALKIADGFLKKVMPGPDSRRQLLNKAYFAYSIYASWCKAFKKYKSFYQPRTIPYVLKREQKVDVDDNVDFYITECIMKKYALSKER